MDKWIMKEHGDGCFMGIMTEQSKLHPRDQHGPYVKSEDVNVILAERDGLAAELAAANATLEAEIAERDRLRKDLNDIGEDYHRLAAELAAANDTMDRLREIIPKHLTPGRAHRLYVNDVIRAAIVLYPPETTNDDR